MRLPRHPAILAALLVVLIACHGDPISPERAVVVTVRPVSPPVPVMSTTFDGEPWIACDVELEARALGSASATWLDASIRYYAGVNRATPIDSETVVATEIATAWGGPSIESSQTPRTNWSFTAGVPFEVGIDFRYQPQGSGAVQTAATRFACGAPPPPGVVAAPTVTQLALPTLGAEIQPGDSIIVNYTASTSYGLWATVVVVSGPFEAEQMVGEKMVASVNRSVTIKVPPSALPGIPISVTAYAFDGALQAGSQSVQTQTTIVDRTPPSITRILMGALPRDPIAGQYAVTDTIDLFVAATDNGPLRWLIYELGAPANVRDSLRTPVEGPSSSWLFRLPVRDQWLGSPILSFTVRDAAGNNSAVRRSLPDSVRFFPVVAKPTSAVLALSPPGNSYPSLRDIVYDARRGLLFMSLSDSRQLDILDVGSMTLQSPVTLPANLGGMDLSVSGDSLLFTMPASRALGVLAVDRRDAAPESIPMPILDTAATLFSGMAQPWGVRVAANGKAIVTLREPTRGGDEIFEVDLGTGTQRFRADARASAGAYGTWNERYGRSEDRSRLVLLGNCPRSYAAATDAFSPCRYLPTAITYGLTFDAGASRLTFGPFVLDDQLKVVRTAPPAFGSTPSLALSPDGADVYLGGNGSVTRMRVATGFMIERYPVPMWVHRMIVSPNGDWLLAIQMAGLTAVRVAKIDLR